MPDDEPTCAADPRPNGEPYYIDSECPECGTELVLFDADEQNSMIWHDEWWCPTCEDGIYLDWPEESLAALGESADEIKNDDE